MPLQLLFTSSPQGLTPGRSGYCTVARHRAIPERLAQQLEALGTPHAQPEGATFTFRSLEAAGKNWFVLSRFVARGLDYTQRDNRLAHHLVFDADETKVLPPPAAIAARWAGWKDEWSAPPSWLEGDDKPLSLTSYPPLAPAIRWRELTGTGAKAAWLVNSSGAATVGLINPPDTLTLLRLFAESSSVIDQAAWAANFTTDARNTGSEGFQWAAHHSSNSANIDFAQATSLPAPIGQLARKAAIGPTSQTKPSTTPSPTHTSPNKNKNSQLLIWTLSLGTLLCVGALAIVFNQSTYETPPQQVAVPKPPPPLDSKRADEILSASRAATEIQSYLESDDLMSAGRLWNENSARSTHFTSTYREQLLSRILRDYSTSVVRQLHRRMDRYAISEDSATLRALRDEARTAIQIGTDLGAPQDAAWRLLTNVITRAELLLSLDIRPVLLMSGEWRTGGTGPNQPSQAEFPLSRKAAEHLMSIVESSGATIRSSVSIRLRLLPLTSLHQRDDQTKWLSGEIRRTPQATWIESTPEAGRLPAIGIGLGIRRDIVSLHFPGNEGNQLDVNRLIEIALPKNKRHCIGILGNAQSFRPLDLGPGSLTLDSNTGLVRTSTWAENAAQAIIWAHGFIGLYPDFHEFPDRDLPSIRATRSLIETDLNRVEQKQGPDSPSFESLKARRQFFNEGNLIEAGAPWSLRTIDTKGNGGPRLIDLH